jgi:hypothetical protein
MHYQRWRRHGSVDLPSRPAHCALDGCDRTATTSGWCSMHLKRLQKTGDVGPAERLRQPNGEFCIVPGCLVKAGKLSMCNVHYMRQRRTGSFDLAARSTVCSVDGCDRVVTSKGRCQLHYNRHRRTGDVGPPQPILPMRTWAGCLVDGCSNLAATRGWCTMHYKRYCNTGSTGPAEPLRGQIKRNTPSCLIDDCDRHVHARGYCQSHYTQLRKTGTTGPIRAYGTSKKPQCKADDCDRISSKSGLCEMHYGRLYRTGSTELTERPTVCSVEGCEKPVNARGWCMKHYCRWKKHRTVELQVQAKPGTCLLLGCSRPVATRGWCTMHYRRVITTGELGPVGPMPRKAKPVCSIEDCDSNAIKDGYCRGHYTRLIIYGDPYGNAIIKELEEARLASEQWVNNDNEYIAVHRRLYRVRGSARAHTCSCGHQAIHWAYTYRCPNELLSPRGAYSLNLEEYVPLCGLCHRALDRAMEAYKVLQYWGCDSCIPSVTDFLKQYKEVTQLLSSVYCAIPPRNSGQTSPATTYP